MRKKTTLSAALLNPDSSTMQTLYLIEQGATLNLDGDRLVVQREGVELARVSLLKLSDVLVYGNISISTPALKKLFDRGIDVTLLTIHGRYHGRLVGPLSPHAALRRAQYRCADDERRVLATARAHVLGKVRNCRAVLQRLARNRSIAPPEADLAVAKLARHLHRAQTASSVDRLRGAEGNAAARYFRGLGALIDPTWGFRARVRRPPTDPVNVLLSFGYTLLTHKAVGAVQAVGLDPYVGSLHSIDYNRPSLALDLVEEFRPFLVDALVVRVLGDGRFSAEEFAPDAESGGLRLSDAAVRRFVAAFEDRMRTEALHPEGADSRPGRVSYLRCIELQARRLARSVRDDAPYEAFGVR
jgi:CRISPR-associated protein Cas1